MEKNQYKVKAKVEVDKFDGDIRMEISSTTDLEASKNSRLNRVLKLKDGDQVEITVKVLKRK